MIRNGVKHRRSLRLKGYDYAQAGAYFVTICAQDRACLFGDVVEGSMCLNDAGRMLIRLWNGIPARFPAIEIDLFAVMPNHLHGIIVLADVPDTGATTRVAPTADPVHAEKKIAPTLGEVVGAFKSASTVEYIRGVKARAWPEFRRRLWQRNYYEHIIRDETSLNRIRRYIDENPLNWALDDENPRNVAP